MPFFSLTPERSFHDRLPLFSTVFPQTSTRSKEALSRRQAAPRLLRWWGLLACAATFVVGMAGCGEPPNPLAKLQIQQVIVIVQENRTPDNLFHGLRGADIANEGLNSKGETVRLTPIPLANNYDLSHTHSAFVAMRNGGRMNGADKILITCNGQHCPPPNPQFHYVNPKDVAPYFQLAETYTFADRMFQTNQGPSFPAHQFIISGTSAPTSRSNLFAAENPAARDRVTNAFFNAGCTAPPTEYVAMIDPRGLEDTTQYPCFDHLTIMDFLDYQRISWRYYAPSAGIIWNAPNAIGHLRFGPDWTNVILQPAQFFIDIDTFQLPTVSWVIPTGIASDHPGGNGEGPSWVASLVNAIGNSPYWSHSVIFITWDDWGGWYDHVPPPIHNAYEYGFRVPLIVVSPYVKPEYVSHVTHDFGSILKFIENNFRLPSLGYADAPADDLSDCFDFNQVPLTFTTIRAPLDAKHFIEDKRPPTDPDDD
ncbi:MAG TPA: alkaline phosphatase family protein [Terriglobales bacterium]|nr:alkaline phosphatase family protein [Terriglobales bacterium]